MSYELQVGWGSLGGCIGGSGGALKEYAITLVQRSYAYGLQRGFALLSLFAS